MSHSKEYLRLCRRYAKVIRFRAAAFLMTIHDIVSLAKFDPAKMGKADLLSSDRLFTGLNAFEPGQEHKLHTHDAQDKLYFVLQGTGEATVGSDAAVVQAGDLVLARAGKEHALRNPGPGRLVVMVVMAPPPKK